MSVVAERKWLSMKVPCYGWLLYHGLIDKRQEAKLARRLYSEPVPDAMPGAFILLGNFSNQVQCSILQIRGSLKHANSFKSIRIFLHHSGEVVKDPATKDQSMTR